MITRNNLAFQAEVNDCLPLGLSQASVVGQVGNRYLLQAAEAPGQARLSASCLLRPAMGDEVLVFSGKGAEAYIVSVLERAAKGIAAEIELPGNTEVTCPTGKLSIHAQALSLSGRDTVALRGKSLSLQGEQTELRSRRLNGWFGEVDVKAISFKAFARHFSGVYDRVIQKAKESFRWVQGKDEVRAGRVRVHAKDHVQVTSTHTSIRTTGYVKIDGKKIDLG